MNRVKDETIRKARGPALTCIGHGFAMSRKWFGLEPDFLFRRRIERAVRGDGPRPYLPVPN